MSTGEKQLSEHFTLAELTRSQTAVRHGWDLTPPPLALANLRRLATLVLEPIRRAARCPIVITSGYRSLTLNTLIGGAKDSDHMRGLAADIHAVGLSLPALGRIVRRIAPEIPLRKAIEEFGQWIHVAVAPEDELPKREFLAATHEGGGTVYRTWNA